MGAFSNRISREALKPGDHVYTMRGFGSYAHHAIFDGDDTVIHFTMHAENPGLSGSLEKDGFGIVSSTLDSFLSGGSLRRFEYGVSKLVFLTRRAGTCTMAESDPGALTVHRAKYLLAKGFGRYNLKKNNCENFAVYCKTGLVLVRHGYVGHSGQVSRVIPSIALGSTVPVILGSGWIGMQAVSVFGLQRLGLRRFYCQHSPQLLALFSSTLARWQMTSGRERVPSRFQLRIWSIC